MFSELIEMAGKLSRTFGSTLAATLKAAAPSIEAIAKATGTVADAFNRLPDSIKGALGLWVTFGKAGSTALTALKTGMLDNIQRTLSYRKTLADLGLSAGDAGISFGRLVQAQVKMRNGNIAGVLSDSAKGMSGLSSAAKDAAPGILAVCRRHVRFRTVSTMLHGPLLARWRRPLKAWVILRHDTITSVQAP